MDNVRWEVKHVAEYLGVAEWTVRHWVSQGKIPYYKLNGRLVRFSKREIDRWLRSQQKGPKLPTPITVGRKEADETTDAA